MVTGFEPRPGVGHNERHDQEIAMDNKRRHAIGFRPFPELLTPVMLGDAPYWACLLRGLLTPTHKSDTSRRGTLGWPAGAFGEQKRLSKMGRPDPGRLNGERRRMAREGASVTRRFRLAHRWFHET
jgi:hypothetical protein